MPGPRPVACIFPEAFLQEALRTVRQRTASVQAVQRFRLALLLHETPEISSDMAGEIVGLSARQVQRWRSRWARGEYSIDDLEGRGRKATFSPAGPRTRYGHRVRNRRRNEAAPQSAIPGRPHPPSQRDARKAHEPHDRLAHLG
jgi:hypothetical protein